MMLRKITLLQLSYYWPTAEEPPSVRSCMTKVGPTTVNQLLIHKCWTNVGPLSAGQQ